MCGSNLRPIRYILTQNIHLLGKLIICLHTSGSVLYLQYAPILSPLQVGDRVHVIEETEEFFVGVCRNRYKKFPKDLLRILNNAEVSFFRARGEEYSCWMQEYVVVASDLATVGFNQAHDRYTLAHVTVIMM